MPISPKDLISNLGELPPLPQVAAQVLRISSDPDLRTEDLQKVITVDQALAAQILKISNSAMFGMMREVKTLTQAIMTLGLNTIRSVVIASSAKNFFGQNATGLQERLLWEHALVSGFAARGYARAIKFPKAEEAFLGGLMHDIGKSVMGIKFKDRYSTLIREVYNEKSDGLSLEADLFGFDHTMVGEALLMAWNLAESLASAVRWHHDPACCPPEHQDLTALVALGNQMALDLNIGLGKPEHLNNATQSACEILRLEPSTLEEHRATVLAIVEADKVIISEL